MKTLLFILVALVLISSCSQTTKKIEKTDAEKYGLRGKVKSICISNYKAKENFGIDVLKNGRLKDDIIFPFGSDSCYKINELGRFIERAWIPFDDNGQNIMDYSKIKESNYHMLKEENIYDANKLIRKIETNADNSIMTNSYVYNDNGKLDSIKHCNRLQSENSGCGNGNVSVKYKYDVNGFIASETFVYNGDIRSNNIYTCDERGNIIIDREYGYNDNTYVHGDLISTTNYEYDELNRVILKRIIKIAQGPRNEEYRYKYYKDNKIAMIERTTFSETSQNIITYNYLYDFNDDILEEIFTSKSGLTITTFKYTYDKMGNWIKKNEYINDKPTSIIERSIEYF